MSNRRLAIVGGIAGVLVLVTAALLFRPHLAHLPVVGRFLAPAAAPASASDVYFCPMHPEVRQNGPGTCPKCGMDLVKEDAPGVAPMDDHSAHGAEGDAGGAGADATDGAADATTGATTPRGGVQLDLRRQQLVGVRLAEVREETLSPTIRAVGTVTYDETRLHDVNLKVEGWIRDLHVNATGQAVRRGQALFTLYSPELLTTQNEYLLALRTRDQLQASTVADAREYTGRLVAAARQRLTLWDLPAREIERLEKTREARAELTFVSPASGVVIEKRAVEGMRVMPGESLFRLADLSTVWVEADVYESELASVRPGVRATVTLDAYPGESFPGRVAFIYPYVGDATRTVKVRVVLANRGGRLKPGMFANVELATPARPALTVPVDAVVDSGRAQFVFVSQGDGYFEPRRIEAGRRVNGRVEVREGLAAGDQVASGATFFIDSESQLRAAMQGFDEPPALSGGAGEAASALRIEFATIPDPPRNGDNTWQVTVRDASGAPVTDATVDVRIYMAPMPSMNMPAMWSDARLLHTADGVYRGQANVSMAGRWDVTVTVSRDGERLGRRMFAIVAR